MPFMSSSALAQDIIILKNGDEMKCKVIEISQNDIKYKNTENIQGSLVSVPINNVYAVKYENGTVALINHETIIKENTSKSTAESQKIKKKQDKKTNDKVSTSLYAGVSFPLGQFADKDKGAARTGFSASAELLIKTRFPFLTFECEGNYTTHALNVENSSLYKNINARYDLGNLVFGYRLHTPLKNFKVFVSILAGINFTAVDGKSYETINGKGIAFYPGTGIIYKRLTVGTRYLFANPGLSPYSYGKLINVRAFQILAGFKL